MNNFSLLRISESEATIFHCKTDEANLLCLQNIWRKVKMPGGESRVINYHKRILHIIIQCAWWVSLGRSKWLNPRTVTGGGGVCKCGKLNQPSRLLGTL